MAGCLEGQHHPASGFSVYSINNSGRHLWYQLEGSQGLGSTIGFALDNGIRNANFGCKDSIESYENVFWLKIHLKSSRDGEPMLTKKWPEIHCLRSYTLIVDSNLEMSLHRGNAHEYEKEPMPTVQP